MSYGAYVACLTPQLVVLVELLDPGFSSWEIAEMRALFTVIGGAVAVAGCLLLWPSWEPERLRRELTDTAAAYGRYAHAVLSLILGEASAAVAEESRRAGGRRQQQSGGLAHPRAAGAAARAAAAAGIGHGGRLHLAPPRRSPQHAAAWPWAGRGRRAGLLAGMA